MTEKALLECKEIMKSFGGVRALNGISFEVGQGEIVGIIGPNGAGKTTLFNVISGLIPPDSGVVRLSGKNISNLRPHKICRLGVARTFQTVRPFLNFTALENVQVGLLFAGGSYPNMKASEKDALQLLDLLDIGVKGRVLAKNMNLMERKKVELVRALAARPKLLLLDEILSGLGTGELESATQWIRDIRDKNRVSIVWIEHLMKPLMRTCDRIIVMQSGRNIAEGTPQEVFAKPQVIEAYLGKKKNDSKIRQSTGPKPA
jgi:branched-chain amino acid transport system ATP-binding protein